MPSPFLLIGCWMNFNDVVRYVILALSSAAIIAGILITIGMLVPTNIPSQFRIIVGILLMLYGGYRFSIVYFRRNMQRDHENHR